MKNRNAFTMLELVFVITIIGILTAIAIPKLAATRDDATITKAITTVASVRSAISAERQKRILRSSFTGITDLALANGNGNPIFDFFDGNSTLPILEYPIRACKDASARGCWVSTANNTYVYRMPTGSTNVTFTLLNNRLTCDTTNADCRTLSE